MDQAGNSAAAGAIGTLTLNIAPANAPDLTAVVTSKPPRAVLGGSKGKATVKITNLGQTPASVPVGVTLYVSDDATFSANDVAVKTITKNFKLKTNKSKSVKFSFVYPGTLGAGNYFLIARADSTNAIAETKERNNFGATAATVNIAPPFVDLQATLPAPTGKLTPGGAAVAVVNVINAGNVTLSKPVSITLAASLNGVSSTLTTFTKKLKIGAGKSAKVKIKFTFPNTLTAGAYTLTATVDSAGSIGESDKTNNVGTSPAFNIA